MSFWTKIDSFEFLPEWQKCRVFCSWVFAKMLKKACINRRAHDTAQRHALFTSTHKNKPQPPLSHTCQEKDFLISTPIRRWTVNSRLQIVLNQCLCSSLVHSTTAHTSSDWDTVWKSKKKSFGWPNPLALRCLLLCWPHSQPSDL